MQYWKPDLLSNLVGRMDCVTLNYRLSHALTDYVQALDVSCTEASWSLEQAAM